ncbi:Fc.00g001110.m01.CDS01 [Cosmosporella sp. VM-42]
MSSAASSQPPPGNTAASASDGGLKIWSCVICRRRKIRCDRRDPCANCVKSNIDCHYPVTGRIPRRNRDPAAWKSPAQKQSELLSRLRRLESVVTELAAQVEDGSTNIPNRWPTPSTSGPESSANADESSGTSAVTAPSDSSSSIAPTANIQAGSEFDEEFGRLVIDKGGGLHVGNRFWSVFCSEVDNILQAVHDVADYDTGSTSSATLENEPESDVASLSHQGFVFGNMDTIGNLDRLSPLPPQMLFIWQTYVENVDPFIKVLHIPSIGRIIHGLRGKLSSLGPSTEALLFAISLAAIASMGPEAIVANFDIPKPQLLARYRFGTEQALAKAGFLTTKEFVIVQSFVIYISILPHIGMAEISWPLTGTLLRIAKSIGLHRDSGGSPVSELDREMRCRLWWQICFIDSRTRNPNAPELSINRTSFDMGLPKNIDDADLDASRPQLHKTETSVIVLTLIRCELWQLAQDLRIESARDYETKLDIVRSARSKVESTYLQFLRPHNSFEAFAKEMTNLFFAKVELIIYSQRLLRPAQTTSGTATSSGQEAAASALGPALIILEASHALKTDPRWKKWQWQLQGQVPWHAMGIFLHQACYRPWGPILERAWVSTTQLIDIASDHTKDNPLWQQLNIQVANTQRYREAEMTRSANKNSEAQATPNISSSTLSKNDSTSGSTMHIAMREATDPSIDRTVLASSMLQAADNNHISREWHDFQFDQSSMYLDPSTIATPVCGPIMDTVQFAAVGQVAHDTSLIDSGPINWQTWDENEGMDFTWDLVNFD